MAHILLQFSTMLQKGTNLIHTKNIKGGTMKRLLTVLLLVAMLSVFSSAKKVDVNSVNPSENINIENNTARFENPLQDFGPSYKGKTLVKATKDLNVIHLGFNNIDVRSGEPEIAAEFRADNVKSTSNYYIVQFTGPVQESYKDLLKSYNVVFEWPVRNYAFLVKMDNAVADKIKDLSIINFVGLYHPAYKVDADWLASESDLSEDFVIRLHKSADMGMVVDELNRMGIKITEISSAANTIKGIAINTSLSKVKEIVKITDVFSVSRRVKNYPMNDNGRAIMMEGAAATLADTILWEHGIYGAGEVVNVTDSGMQMLHYAFYDASVALPTWGHYPTHRKVIAYLPTLPSFLDTLNFGDEALASYHGSHTTGTVAGNDAPNAASTYDGIAKDAKLFFMDAGNTVDDFLWVPVDMYTMFDTMYVHGVRVSSNSYGSSGAEWMGAYSDGSQMIDAYTWDHKDFVPVFSAGNEGSGAQTISTSPSAKNVVAVGAHSESSPNSIANFSSRGPTADGRWGVTICAPGVDVTSVSGSTSGATSNYTSMDGTSMSCPFTAGSVALIRDWLKQGFYPTGSAIPANAVTDPTNSLIRALLVNSANNMLQTVPNTNVGFGRIQLNNICFFNDADSPRAVAFHDNQDGLLTGEYVEYQFNISSAATELKVSLAWTDYPAPFFGDNTVTDTTLVNDLNLTLESPTGTPYVINDHLNTIEQIIVATPELGVWKIRVSGTEVNISPQTYSIVVSYDVLNMSNGSVMFDKAVYSAIDNNAVVTVTDADGASPIDVMVYSMLGDTETVTCTGTSGLFEGSITIGYDLNANNDGLLAVTANDTLWAIYNDLSPVQTLRAMATTDGNIFTIYNVRLSAVEGTRAFIAWNTTEVATGKVYYGTTTALGSETAVDPNLVTDHSGDFAIILSSLSPNTVYYYDVESVDHKGNTVRDDNGGNHYSFATVDISGTDILVLLTDDNQDYASGDVFAHPDFLINAINEGGWTYAWWTTSVNNFGIVPVTDLMQNYKAVFLQTTQENYPPLTKNQEDSLGRYQENGGRIAYTGHDLGWAMQDPAAYGSVGTDSDDSLWIADYLLAQYWFDIIDAGDFTIYGVASDPISGDYTAGVSYNPFREGADGDLFYTINNGFVNGTASTVWNWNDGTNVGICGSKWESQNTLGSAGVGVWGGYRTRVIYNAFEITQIDTADASSANRTNILNNDLIWLIGHDHPDVTLTAPTGGEVFNSSPISISWTASADAGNGATLDSVFLYYSPNGGDVWYELDKGTDAEVTSPYSWDVSSLTNGEDYVIKVKVKDGGVYPAMLGMDQSDPFTINIIGNDDLGPIVYAGSVQTTINPIGNRTGGSPDNTFTLTAIVCDSSTGMSTVGAAEWSYGATPAPAGTGNAMTAVDGTFDEMYEEATATVTVDGTWPSGDVKIWVRGRDSSPAKSVNNWGSAVSTDVTILNTLTVKLASFTALSSDNEVTLRWRTESETNNAYFIVQKSSKKDGEYRDIATISASASGTYEFRDEDVFGGEVNYYRLTDVSTTGAKITHPAIKVLVNGRPRPTTYALTQNMPNPFTDRTMIEYSIPVEGKVELGIYDVTGKLIRTLVSDNQSVNYYRVMWNGTDNSGNRVASGVYFYKLSSGNFETSQKMTFLK